MPGRYLSLGHWRGAAALWVMFYHSFNLWLLGDPTRLPAWLRAVLTSGWQGVSVFFVVSGYCIAERLAADLAAGRGPGRFLADRALRIYPAFWCALGFSVILEFAALPFNFGSLRPSGTSFGILPYSVGEGLANLLLVETWFAPRSWLLVSWSLDYEVGFYALAALALGLMQWQRSPWPGLGLGAAAFLAGLLGPGLPVLSLFPHFALGGLAWLLLRGLPTTVVGRSLAAGGLFGAIWWFAPMAGDNARSSLQCAAATAGALVLLRPLDAHVAAFRPLHWLGWVGTLSYSLYLVHAPIVGKFRNLAFSVLPPTAPGACWVPVAGGGVALLAATGFYLLIEAPFERLRRRVLAPSLP